MYYVHTFIHLDVYVMYIYIITHRLLVYVFLYDMDMIWMISSTYYLQIFIHVDIHDMVCISKLLRTDFWYIFACIMRILYVLRTYIYVCKYAREKKICRFD